MKNDYRECSGTEDFFAIIIYFSKQSKGYEKRFLVVVKMIHMQPCFSLLVKLLTLFVLENK